MQRKIIQQSLSSVGISLPIKWIKQWNLKKGDLVNIEENKGILEIKPINFSHPEKTATMDAHLYGKLSKRVFDNLSKLGFDEIKIVYENEKELEPIKETLKTEATMFEIVKKERDYVITKAVSSMHHEEIGNLINRIIMLLREKINKIQEYLKTESKELLFDIIELEKANHRLTHACLRAIQSHSQEEKSYIRYTLVWELGKLRDDFRLFAELNSKNIKKETKEIFKLLCNNVHILTELYFKYEPEKAVELFKLYKQIENKCIKELKSRKDVKDHPLIYLALSINEKNIYLLGLVFSFKQNQ